MSGKCKDCGKPTAARKDGQGFYVRCFPCGEKAKAAWNARGQAQAPQQQQEDEQRQLTVDEAFGADKAHVDVDYRAYQQELFLDCCEDASAAMFSLAKKNGADSIPDSPENRQAVRELAMAFFSARCTHHYYWTKPRPKGEPIRKAFV